MRITEGGDEKCRHTPANSDIDVEIGVEAGFAIIWEPDHDMQRNSGHITSWNSKHENKKKCNIPKPV